MSIGSIIGGGIRLVRTQPQVVAIWVVLYGIGMAILTIATRPLMASITGAQQQVSANAALGIKSAPVFPGAALGNLFILQFVVLVLIVIGFAAVVRAVVRPTGDRFAYLRLGMDELRLIGLGILLTILFFLAEIVGVVAIIAVAASLAYIAGKTGGIVIGAVMGIALLLAFIYVQVRMSLAGALTVIEGRIVVKDAWRVTKGRFWTLFGAYLVIVLVIVIVGVTSLALTNPQLLSAYAHFSPQAVQAAAQDQYKAQASGWSIAFIARMIAGAIIGVPMYAVFFGAIATAAVEMSGIEKSIAVEFE